MLSNISAHESSHDTDPSVSENDQSDCSVSSNGEVDPQLNPPSPEPAKKVIDQEKVVDFKAKCDRTGLLYMSNVPPFMPPNVVRKLLSQFGTIGRIYLAPEDPKSAAKRKKYKKNGRKFYVEGWVEVMDKREAKTMAATLNNEQVGGKSLFKWHHCIWNLKYLPKFKWHHLNEQMAFERQQREQRLRAEITQAKRENQVFLDNISKSKMIQALELKKRKLGDEKPVAEQQSGTSMVTPHDIGDIRRRFKQRKVVHDHIDNNHDQDFSKVKSVLSKIFS